MQTPISILWFRQDLRLSDNPALLAAARFGVVLPIYIWDDLSPSPFRTGAATKLYLHHSLLSLDESLNNQLNFYTGKPEVIILDLIKQYKNKIIQVFWNRCYEPWYLSHDESLKQQLRELNVGYEIFNGSYLWTPEAIKKENSYYKVFGAYKRKVYAIQPRAARPKPNFKNLNFIKDQENQTVLDDFELIPNYPWVKKIKSHWDFGEKTAQKKLNNLLNKKLLGYKAARDYPGLDQTSKLSVNLHFGEISPYQIWEAVHSKFYLGIPQEDLEHFCSEMIWREFSAYLLFHFPKLPAENFQAKFNTFPWHYQEQLFQAWKTGCTGYPFIDAGMRELWQTGYMHNRVRMVVASFLVKNLMIHWHYGRDWFWDCLVDADLANNSASWQWVAGSGVDAAPYFRIFNPITQGEKFDKQGIYTRKFVPELANLPDKYLFKPWEAPEEILKKAGVVLGLHYPKPIIDLKSSRARALAVFNALRL
ncbi:MAG: cryptochrome/photolyase family protein [Gammaproteobacteria bacterium]